MTHPYQNASLPIPERVADLLGRMTLEEKVAQLHGLLDIGQIVGEGNRFSPEAACRLCPRWAGLRRRPWHRPDPAEAVEFVNALQILPA